MSKLSLCDKVYEKNKRYWNEQVRRNRIVHLHHIFGRSSPIFKCCPLTWVALTNPEHNDWQILKDLKNDFEYIKRYVLSNYIKNLGCKKTNPAVCKDCKMPKAEDV